MCMRDPCTLLSMFFRSEIKTGKKDKNNNKLYSQSVPLENLEVSHVMSMVKS